MLKKLLSQKVRIGLSNYAWSYFPKGKGNNMQREGIVTDIDDNFIELDNEMIIAIKSITYIQAIS